MSGAMAAAASSIALPFAVSSTYSSRKQRYLLSSSVTVLNPRNSISHLYISAPLLGFGHFPVWSGLKHLGISLRRGTQEVKNKRRGNVVYASLFGVGAPEALVIGVVALLVFGPKGLAEVARNLGKTLRAFQPTIRELQDVSREFKSTLEREIGLDEVQATLQSPYKSGTPVTEKPLTQKPQTVIDPSAAADQEAPVDSVTSAESVSKNATSADVPSTPVTVTADSNASYTTTEPDAALSEIHPTDGPVINKNPK